MKTGLIFLFGVKSLALVGRDVNKTFFKGLDLDKKTLLHVLLI